MRRIPCPRRAIIWKPLGGNRNRFHSRLLRVDSAARGPLLAAATVRKGKVGSEGQNVGLPRYTGAGSSHRRRGNEVSAPERMHGLLPDPMLQILTAEPHAPP